MTYARLNRNLRLALCAALVVVSVPVTPAQEAAPAIDAALDQLLQQDPAALAEHLKAMKATAAQQDQEAAELRKKSEALNAQAADIETRLNQILTQAKALTEKFSMVPGEAMAAAPMAEAAPMAPAAPPAEVAMAVAPAEDTSPVTSYAEHVKPILEARCFRCHNADTTKGGLNLASHATALAGGSSGPILTAGDPGASRVLKLVMQTEEPKMPPSGDPLTPEQIEIIRKWIADGAPADGTAKRMAKKEEAKSDAPVFVAANFDGPPPMPEVALEPPHTLPGRGVVARAVDTSPRSPLMAVGGDRQVLIYQTDTNTLLGALPFPEGDVYTLTFSVNGEMLLAGGGQEGNTGISVLWNIRTGQRVGTYGEYYDTVLAADISPDHRMIALGGSNKKVRVYSTETGAELYTLEKHNDWIQAVKFTPDGEILTTADRAGGMYVWQAANGREVEQLRGHEGGINGLAYTADSNVLASVGDDGTVKLWDTWKYTQIRSFQAHNKALYVDINAEGQIITAGADHTTKVWAQDGTQLKAFPDTGDWVYAACFAQNKRIVGGTWSGSVIMWDFDSGNQIALLSTNPPAGSA